MSSPDYSYTPPILTVDAVVFQLIGSELSVLLIRRAREPFKDAWALPGGYNNAGETTREATARVLRDKSGVSIEDLPVIEQLHTFDTVARDPRGHAVSVTYLGLGKDVVPKSNVTTQTPQFFPLSSLPKLAYDHADIITKARARLQSDLTHTNAVFALLPKLFTLSQLQIAYEAVFGHEFDKRNFRKKFNSFECLQETTELYQGGAHRPARLYKFTTQGLQPLSRSFD